MEMFEQFGIVIVFLIIAFAGSGVGTFMQAAINFFLELFSRIFGV
jgi:hypothetical protein